MNIYKIYFFTVVTILFGTQYLVSSKETVSLLFIVILFMAY
jgi:hypothetical protein